MAAYRIFTVSSGTIKEGAMVETLTLKGAGIDIPAVIVGEEGRGRNLGVLPVQLPEILYKEWQESGRVEIRFAEVGSTKAEKPKLLARNGADSDEKIIVVFRTSIGFRGGNTHTGDSTGTEEKHGRQVPVFADFPGEILVKGQIAQGIAGYMGSGDQLVAVMPKGTVFRTGYSGRLYGAPAAHYYLWNGEQLLAATWEEREVSDIF